MMATYNGGEYIREQIDSIISQTWNNWKLLIRDDGSSDHTISIIKEFVDKDNRISLTENHSDYHGWQRNFQQLILQSSNEADYYMFCDQDDIWKPNKIEVFVDEMKIIEQSSNSKAVIVYGDMEIIDESGKVTQNSFNSIYNMKLKHSTDSFFSQRIYGCNMMINSVLMNQAKKTLADQTYSDLCHDGFIAKVTAATDGVIHFIDIPYMQYRRYGGNATGNQEFAITWNRIFSRLKKFNKLAKDQNSTYVQSLHVIDLLHTNLQLDENQRKCLKEIYVGIERGGYPLIRLWLKYKVDCGDFRRTISHFLVLMTGKWK
jgi:rhamnosyltransferase